jgi:subtilisin family serine protease
MTWRYFVFVQSVFVFVELTLTMASKPATTLAITGPLDRSSYDRWESIAGWSSGGPTLDGRIKPDVMAPGDAIYSAKPLTSAQAASGGEVLINRSTYQVKPFYLSSETVIPFKPFYLSNRSTFQIQLVPLHQGDTCQTTKLSGTSMATPLAAGAVALLRQYFVDGYYPSGVRNAADAVSEPSAALLKAVLINGASPMEGFDTSGYPIEPPPSSRQGWGRINLAASVPLGAAAGRAAGIPNNIIAVDRLSDPFTAAGQTYGVCLEVTGSTEALKVTLVWTDPAPAVVSDGSLVNDLDLKLLHLASGGAAQVEVRGPIAQVEVNGPIALESAWFQPLEHIK